MEGLCDAQEAAFIDTAKPIEAAPTGAVIPDYGGVSYA
jgi:hypothetical protein